MPDSTDLIDPISKSLMERMSCSLLTLDPGESTEQLRYEMAESVYFVVGGFGLFRMCSSSAEYHYPVKQGTAIWMSDSAEHAWLNDGEGPLRCLCIQVRVDQSVQERGKEVQRRIVDTNTLPFEFQDQGGTMKIAFRGAAIPTERIDTVEYLATPPSGHKPAHHNRKIEGILYFTRGNGTAARNGEVVAIKAGDLVTMPKGAHREFEAAPGSWLECVVLNVLI